MRSAAAGADIILLDKFALEDLRAAVALRDARPAHETRELRRRALKSLRAIAETGVDYISVGSLTKHLAAIDLSMRLESTAGDPPLRVRSRQACRCCWSAYSLTSRTETSGLVHRAIRTRSFNP